MPGRALRRHQALVNAAAVDLPATHLTKFSCRFEPMRKSQARGGPLHTAGRHSSL